KSKRPVQSCLLRVDARHVAAHEHSKAVVFDLVQPRSPRWAACRPDWAARARRRRGRTASLLRKNPSPGNTSCTKALFRAYRPAIGEFSKSSFLLSEFELAQTWSTLGSRGQRSTVCAKSST